MTKDEFLKLGSDTDVRAVEVPEWGSTIHVRTMTGTERSQFKSITDKLNKSGHEADADTWLVLLCACDLSGNRIFNDADFGLLNSKSAKVITSIARECLVVNGLMPESLDIEKKDFVTTRS